MVKPTRAELRHRALAELDLPPDAQPEDVKSRYRSLILAHHPDKNEGSQESVEKTQRLNEAWEILSKPENVEFEYDEQEILRHFAGLFARKMPFAFFEHHGKTYVVDLGFGGPGMGGGQFRGGNRDRERGGQAEMPGAQVEDDEYSDGEDEYSSDGSYTDTEEEEESYYAKLRGYTHNAIFSALNHDKSRPRQSKMEAEAEHAKILERIKEQELAQERREEERQKLKEKKEQEREQEMAEGAARRAQKNSQKKAVNKAAAEEASAKANSQRHSAQKLRSETFKAARKGDVEGVKKGVWEHNVAPDGGEWLEGFEPVDEKVEVKVEVSNGGEQAKEEKGRKFRPRREKVKKAEETIDKENIAVRSTSPISVTVTPPENATTKNSTTEAEVNKSKRDRKKTKSPSTPLATVDPPCTPPITEPIETKDTTAPDVNQGDEEGPRRSRRRSRRPRTSKKSFNVVEEDKNVPDPELLQTSEAKSPSSAATRKKPKRKNVATRENGVDSISVNGSSNINETVQVGPKSPLAAHSSTPPSVAIDEPINNPNSDSAPKLSKVNKRTSKSKIKAVAPLSALPSPHLSNPKKQSPSVDPKETLLHLAVSCSSLSLVTWLMSHGALAEERDSSFFTPLHRAIQLGEKDIVEYLLKTNSIPRMESEEGGNAGYPLPPDQTLLKLAIHAPKNKAEVIALVGPHSRKEEAEEAWEIMMEEEYWEEEEGDKGEGVVGEKMKKWEKMRWALVESGVEGWEIPEAWRGRRVGRKTV